MDIREIPRTNEKIKLEYIQQQLQKSGIASTLHTYKRESVRGNQSFSFEFYNLYVKFEANDPKAPTVLVTAHWDTVVEGAENCLDNTASVYNIYRLIEKFQAKQNQLALGMPYNLVLALTDAEEGCSIYHNGALEMALLCDPTFHVDLELTAGGTVPVVDSMSTPLSLPGLIEHRMPYNNCIALRQASYNPRLERYNFDCKLNNLKGAACLTLMTDVDLQEVRASAYCSRWAQCHMGTDLFDDWLNLPEMEAFTDSLVDDLLKWDFKKGV